MIMPVHLQRDALTPTITTHPAGTTLTAAPAGTHTLSVTATTADFGTLTYQWYSNTSNANTGGTPLTGETAATYNAPIDVAGTFYYYVIVINTIPNNGDGGNKRAEKISDSATVTVTNVANPTPPIFDGLEDEYTLGDPALPLTLAVIGEGAAEFTIFRVNGTDAVPLPLFDPTSAGTYLIEALSADETLRIWKYVKILP